MGEEGWLGHVMATTYNEDTYQIKQIEEFLDLVQRPRHQGRPPLQAAGVALVVLTAHSAGPPDLARGPGPSGQAPGSSP